MELEIKCKTRNCNFSTNIDWPEDIYFGLVILASDESLKGTALSKHHVNTRPNLNSEYRGLGYGHGEFTTTYKKKVIVIEANERIAWISTDISNIV
jgi:hypothetical protein